MTDDSKERSRGLAVSSWVLYDFANTIFSMEVYAPLMQGERAL